MVYFLDHDLPYVLPKHTILHGELINCIRLYHGPVGLQRLKLQLVNEYGLPIHLNGGSFSFALEIGLKTSFVSCFSFLRIDALLYIMPPYVKSSLTYANSISTNSCSKNYVDKGNTTLFENAAAHDHLAVRINIGNVYRIGQICK